MTDRSLTKHALPVMKDAVKLFLKPLSEEQKLSFFKNRIEPQLFNLIFDKMKVDSYYFEQVNTPYKMLQFIDIVEKQRMIPDDITAAYIVNLIERERNEKKEIEMRDIEELLQALASYMYENSTGTDIDGVPQMHRVDVLTFLAKVKMALGYNTDTKRLLDIAIGMGILQEEEGMISFINYDFLYYFVVEANDSGIEKVIYL